MSLKKAYLYLVSVISLVIMVIGAIMLLNIGIKTWIFPKADNYVYYAPVCSEIKAPDGTPARECDPKFQEEERKRQEEQNKAQKQRDASTAMAMVIVAGPVWYFHWRLARREQ